MGSSFVHVREKANALKTKQAGYFAFARMVFQVLLCFSRLLLASTIPRTLYPVPVTHLHSWGVIEVN
jgi:hypothetical protein